MNAGVSLLCGPDMADINSLYPVQQPGCMSPPASSDDATENGHACYEALNQRGPLSVHLDSETDKDGLNIMTL